MTTKLPHRLLPACLALLATACTADLPEGNEQAPTDGPLAGQPVNLSATTLAVTPAGSAQTRADAPTESAFPAEGATMTVYLLDEANTLLQQADYTYTGGKWTAPEGESLYWPAATGTYRFTAISPARAAANCADGQNLTVNLPIEWTTDELEEWKELRITYAPAESRPTTSPIALSLRHPLTQVEAVMSSAATAAITGATSRGTLSLTDNTATPLAEAFMTLCKPDEDMPVHRGYLFPSTDATPQLVTDTEIYDLGLPDGQTLQGGEVVSVTDLEGFTVIYTTPGELMNAMNSTPGAWEAQKLVITGQLNQQDINDYQWKAFYEDNIITHLYFYASAPGMEIPAETCMWYALPGGGDHMPALQEIILPKGITAIRDASFFRAENLQRVILPTGIQVIEASCFEFCDHLAYVCWRGTEFPTCGSGVVSDYSMANPHYLLLPDVTDPSTLNLQAIGSSESRWPNVYYNYRGGDLLDINNYTYLDQSTL